MAEENTKRCYIAIFDILGFKEYVKENSHIEVYAKLKTIRQRLQENLERIRLVNKNLSHEIASFKFYEVDYLLFSDTILLITENDTDESFINIVSDARKLIAFCFREKTPIKGCIAKGDITYDKEKDILFGKPIIDAHLLSEDMKFMGVILDKSLEHQVRIPTLKPNPVFVYKKVPLKSGAANHFTLNLNNDESTFYEDEITNEVILAGIAKMYESANGVIRQYYDNTLDLYWSKKEIK